MAGKRRLLILLGICVFLLVFVRMYSRVVPVPEPGSLISEEASSSAETPFIFGQLLVGPYNDHGYSQATYEGGRYVEKMIPRAKMIFIDKVNPADRPGTTIPQLVDDLVEKGARFIIANSDDMKDGIREAALLHPDISFVHVSGDDVIMGKAPKNLSNLFGRMEYAKMMVGFSASLTTQTGKIGYLGPLINEETRRLAASCFLGAKYAWEHVLNKPPEELEFKVTWIGFWFNIPGVTADPTQVAQNFFNSGYDVIVSGIDTTEALVVAQQKHLEGHDVWAAPYVYIDACKVAPDVCLGVPYFNWGPGFLGLINKSRTGTWTSEWLWLGPNWMDINDPDTSAIGFLSGPAMSSDTKEKLSEFIQGLRDESIQLFKGPLNYQDGTPFIREGAIADDHQIWYMKQLLEGMIGQSSAA